MNNCITKQDLDGTAAGTMYNSKADLYTADLGGHVLYTALCTVQLLSLSLNLALTLRTFMLCLIGEYGGGHGDAVVAVCIGS